MTDFTSRSEMRRLAMQAPDKLIKRIEEMFKELTEARRQLAVAEKELDLTLRNLDKAETALEVLKRAAQTPVHEPDCTSNLGLACDCMAKDLCEALAQIGGFDG